MDIKEMAALLKKEIRETFPNGFRTTEERLLSIYRQVADVSSILARQQGYGVAHSLGVQEEYNQSIFGILIDVLLLAEEAEIDYDKELNTALQWFKNKRAIF